MGEYNVILCRRNIDIFERFLRTDPDTYGLLLLGDIVYRLTDVMFRRTDFCVTHLTVVTQILTTLLTKPTNRLRADVT